MRKILIRSGMTSVETVSYASMIQENRLGSNVGNLVYAYSIYKTLMIDEETEFIPTKYKYRYSQEELEKINEECECFIIPLADAVRSDFMKEMKGLTVLVKSLKIPCYIIGMGVRAPYEPEDGFSFSYDNIVKDFLTAVLEKSSIIGIRGSITADYLSRLGFKEESDFTVIGCPSTYMFGRDGISIRKTAISENSKICYNENVLSTDELSVFIRKSAKRFKESYFIPQQVKELKILYAGVPYTDELPKGFPCKITDPVYLNGESLFFGNVPSWINFMKTVDFCFGSRLHGNIVSVLAGTPSILFPFDARARELAEYHKLTNIPYFSVNEDTDIMKLIESVDFNSAEKCQAENFDRFISFLNRNGIEHVYKKEYSKQKIMDLEFSELSQREPLRSITLASKEDIAERLELYHEWNDKVWMGRVSKLEKRIKELEKDRNSEKARNEKAEEAYKQRIADQEIVIREQKRKLNYRSVKAVMTIRDRIEKTGVVKKLKVRK